MANTIPATISERIIARANDVLREAATLTRLVNTLGNAAGKGADLAKPGDTISVPVIPTIASAARTAANTSPAATDVTVTAKTVTFGTPTQTSFPVSSTDVHNYSLGNQTGVIEKLIEECIRSEVQVVNSALWALYYKIPYMDGVHGTSQFASSPDQLADIQKVLRDNNNNDRVFNLVCSTLDYAKALKLSEFQKVNEAGNDTARALGMLPTTLGFDIFYDQDTTQHTSGSITGNPVASATDAGETSVTLTCDTDDAVALKQGDIINFADGYTYSVQADLTIAASNTGTLTLDRGLVAALAGTENPALETGFTASTTGYNSIAGNFNGYAIATRLIDMPSQGNEISFTTEGTIVPIVDPLTGLSMQLGFYSQYGQMRVEVATLKAVDIVDSRRLCRSLTL